MDLTKLNLEAVEAETLTTAEKYSPVPDGEYVGEIISTEDVEKNGNTSIKFVYEIKDAEFSGRRLFDNVIVDGKNEVAVKIGKTKLKRMMAATKKTFVANSEDFLGDAMILKVGQREYNGKAYNNILDYFELGASPEPVVAQSFQDDEIPF